jgi:phosphatidylinositol alpha-mannosyltransferase
MVKKEPKLKIGLILDTSLDPSDGVQQYVLQVGNWLSGEGHDVHYLVGETKHRDLANIHSLAKNISIRFNGNRTTIPRPTSRQKLRSFLDNQNFDVLHVQVPHSPFMAQKLILAASDDTAVIGTFHVAPYGRLAVAGNKALGKWLSPSLKRFDNIVSVSPAASAFALRTFKIKTGIVPNVVDYKLYHDAKPLDKPGKGLNILFLGRLVKRKGCRMLLQAVSLLKGDPALPKFTVTICGQGHLESSLKQFVIKKQLQDIVTFAGFIDENDKPRYYSTADIAVFPSSSGESFGIVLLEAMASGHAAVLAGDNPGYRSVMEPRKKLLFPPKDGRALAEKLRLYLTDNTARAQMAKWGETYSAQFDINKVGPELLNIYLQALRKRRSQ